MLGLERENGLVSRFETLVHPESDANTLLYVERRGGCKLRFSGHVFIGESIRRTYSARGARKFDCKMMALAYGRNFEVSVTNAKFVPAASEMQVPTGGHLKGSRISFDLGASDYEVSAVIDGEAVFTEETPLNPKIQKNPVY